HVDVEEMRPAELIAGLRRPAIVAGETSRSAVQEGSGVEARSTFAVDVLNVAVTAAHRLSAAADGRGQNGAAAVGDRAVPVTVRDGERQTGTPEPLTGPLPAAEKALRDAAVEVRIRVHDPRRVEVVANVVVRVAVVVGPQIGRIDLAQQRVAVGEDTTVGN